MTDQTASALRDQIAAAILGVVAPVRVLVKPEEFRAVNELTDAVLAVILPHGKFLGDQLRDAEAALSEARGQIERVRQVIAERRTEVAEREPDGMLPFGTPGAAWCDAVTVTCDRIDDALKAFPSPALAESPAHNAGPSVAECAEADRRWWGGEKTGEAP